MKIETKNGKIAVTVMADDYDRGTLVPERITFTMAEAEELVKGLRRELESAKR